jgi:hypothetical protein
MHIYRMQYLAEGKRVDKLRLCRIGTGRPIAQNFLKGVAFLFGGVIKVEE